MSSRHRERVRALHTLIIALRILRETDRLARPTGAVLPTWRNCRVSNARTGCPRCRAGPGGSSNTRAAPFAGETAGPSALSTAYPVRAKRPKTCATPSRFLAAVALRGRCPKSFSGKPLRTTPCTADRSHQKLWVLHKGQGAGSEPFPHPSGRGAGGEGVSLVCLCLSCCL
jgi:hypothetical protein